MENNKELEQELIEITQQKEKADKMLLSLEIFIGILVTIIFLSLIFVTSFVQMETWLKALLVLIGLIVFIVGIGFALKIEQTAGYYKCNKCGYQYVPQYNNIFFAMHIGRTRYMKCPQCKEKSWQKKVLTKK